MYCCIPDPALASLLAGEHEVLREARWVAGALALQALALLVIGGLPW